MDYTEKESKQLAKAAIRLVNISDPKITIEESILALKSTFNAFNIK